uniref:ADP-dependent NAD(P)H-hydrate dehydratase n=1 Tax=Neptunicella sp. TaxID=2125986 RepID=UPI003F68F6AF
KGAGSVIITDSQQAICQDGNPGMASAGMGDTLTGIIGALIAQGQQPKVTTWLNSADALLHATALHARAGDLAAQKGGEHGMLASDLILFLRQLVNR